MRIALGAVQFGQPYGIANRTGQVARAEVAAILACAHGAGIDTVDTAIAYGDSEACLGEVGMQGWSVVSKLPAVPNPCSNVADWVEECVSGSLQRLAVPRLYAVLLHKPLELLGANGQVLHQALLSLKRRGIVRKIGTSVYGPADLAALWPRFALDLVQAPLNVLDRRLAESGWLRRLYAAGVEVHTRSTFLQGLLLMRPAQRPSSFSRWQPLWDTWQRWLAENKLAPLEACLGFALAHSEISRVVVGVDSLSQLRQILALPQTALREVPEALSCKDLDLIDPSRWMSA